MASSLEHDLSCPLCSKLYRDPQLLSCGHSFCRRCLNRHFPVHLVRIRCSVCHQVCPYNPVANLVLRNTCESYLREKELESENDAGVRCSLHGKQMSLFCETDNEVICSKCKRDNHNAHNVQPLTHAVHQRKRQVKAALCPAEKALESLRHGTSKHFRLKEKIKYQAQWTEGRMKKDFEKLRQFLKEEEENRVAALREEEQRKTEKVDESVQQVQSLWDNVRKVKDELEDDDATFLENFDSVLWRAQSTKPGRDPDYEVLINVGKHLGNLRYNVCEKMMKNLCPHYPITLDPNTTPAGFSISDDLAELQKSTHELSPFPHQWKRIVLGSEGYTNGFHCWDIYVGNNKYWTIGVCRRTALQNQAEDLSPRNGFWGIRCVGDSYEVLGSTRTCGSWWNWWNLVHKPGTVRVKLGQNLTKRTVSFYNATELFLIASIDVPAHEELFPFLIPVDCQSPMRIVPDDVTVKVKDKFNIIRRSIDVDSSMMPLYEIVLLVIAVFAMLFIMPLFFCIIGSVGNVTLKK